MFRARLNRSMWKSKALKTSDRKASPSFCPAIAPRIRIQLLIRSKSYPSPPMWTDWALISPAPCRLTRLLFCNCAANKPLGRKAGGIKAKFPPSNKRPAVEHQSQRAFCYHFLRAEELLRLCGDADRGSYRMH